MEGTKRAFTLAESPVHKPIATTNVTINTTPPTRKMKEIVILKNKMNRWLRKQKGIGDWREEKRLGFLFLFFFF